MSSLAQSIGLAIQKQEGYGTPQAVTLNANNNPLALIAWPGYPTVNGFAVFPDYQTGFNAGVTNVQSKINQGMTLSQLTNAWAPSGASNDPTGINNPSAYAQFLSSQTGLPLDTPLNGVSVTSDTATDSGSGFDLSSVFDSIGLSPPDSTEAGVVDWSTLGWIAASGVILWLLFRD